MSFFMLKYKNERIKIMFDVAVIGCGVVGSLIARELTKYSKDIDLWQICTATAQVSTDAAVIGAPKTEQDTKGNDWVSYDRKYGSENEACMDVISATSSDIVKFALGAGSNEDLKYE